MTLKDVRAKCFQSIELFFKEIERVENYPDFETLEQAIHHGRSWSNFVEVALLRK